MKSFAYIVVLALFSAVILKPVEPKHYPPVKVMEQRVEIIEKELEIENLINTIELNLEIDSLQIEEISQHHE